MVVTLIYIFFTFNSLRWYRIRHPTEHHSKEFNIFPPTFLKIGTLVKEEPVLNNSIEINSNDFLTFETTGTIGVTYGCCIIFITLVFRKKTLLYQWLFPNTVRGSFVIYEIHTLLFTQSRHLQIPIIQRKKSIGRITKYMKMYKYEKIQSIQRIVLFIVELFSNIKCFFFSLFFCF